LNCVTAAEPVQFSTTSRSAASLHFKDFNQTNAGSTTNPAYNPSICTRRQSDQNCGFLRASCGRYRLPRIGLARIQTGGCDLGRSSAYEPAARRGILPVVVLRYDGL